MVKVTTAVAKFLPRRATCARLIVDKFATSVPPTKHAFFGTGLMGSAFVRRLIANSDAVNIWNRSSATTRALETHGKKAFDDAAAELAEAEHIRLQINALTPPTVVSLTNSVIRKRLRPPRYRDAPRFASTFLRSAPKIGSSLKVKTAVGIPRWTQRSRRARIRSHPEGSPWTPSRFGVHGCGTFA
ncbi:MAG: NAD(P)-binding domain-containing protein [Rubrivivax sp.]